MKYGHVTGSKHEKPGSADWYNAIAEEHIRSIEARAKAPRPAWGITYQERCQDWDGRMRQMQQAERQRQMPLTPRRGRGMKHREGVQAVLAGRTRGR